MAAGKVPQAAFVEDYDEDSLDVVPDSRQSANTTANTAAKLSRLDLRFPAEPLIDGASDSGYSSRTTATVNSTQSGPSGGKSPPVALKQDLPKQRTDLTRKSSSRKERPKDKDRARPERAEKMQMGAYPGSAHHHAHVQRSPSKPRRRDSAAHTRPYTESPYHDGTAPYYQQAPTPIDPRAMDYPSQAFHLSRPPVPDYPPASPQTAGYPYPIAEFHRPAGGRARSGSYRNGMYHTERPISYHGGGAMPIMGPPPLPMYNHHPPQQQQPVYAYDPGFHGPPLSSSAYANQAFSSSFGAGSYFEGSEYGAPSEYPRERSQSRHRDLSRSRARRSSSVYGHPPLEGFSDWQDEGESMDRWSSREVPRDYHRESREYHREPREYHQEPREYHRETREYHREPRRDDRRDISREVAREVPRGRGPVKPRQQEADEDFYRMPPPPPPPPKKSAPQVHLHQAKRPEPRKSQTTNAIPSQRRQRPFDMTDVAAALPPEVSHRLSRDGRMPERSQSVRETRRSREYGDANRGAHMTVESALRHPQDYYYADHDNSRGLEDREREVERYQAQQSGRDGVPPMPPSSETLIPKMATGAASDNGSQKSPSHSSGGSGNGENKNMSLTLNGMTIGFTEEAVAGKSINIRTGETGGVHFSIAGSRQPKKYHSGSSYSDQTGRTTRREIEDVPRHPEDRLSERGIRRSSRSNYGQSRYRA
ncbi:hypothetical protein N7462_011715 [Penicillium macrosclerotiorum]|uniref:uncharacterized protein n=1 Tax=Penicillium macrosclerotiorum TaxID=303699 RepID=UPI0025497491|nr:uncharacterized protein N7462_011715 [Penicillium macrosclerotiorum]KAJ5662789.1 hypothetical protein N7462_011715 [Penicillium macrosclerotiorum]